MLEGLNPMQRMRSARQTFFNSLLGIFLTAIPFLGLQDAWAQITFMPLSAGPDPSQGDDLGSAAPANLYPIGAVPAPLYSMGGAPVDPFGGYGYNPAPTTPWGGMWAPGGYAPGGFSPGLALYDSSWHWQLFPHGWMYPSYLASQRESRMGATFFYEKTEDWLVDLAIGGRVGISRWGTDDLIRPEGFQLDAEAAVFPRFRLDSTREFVSADFRGGLPLTFRRGPFEAKLGYYHFSSHLGDVYIENHPGVLRAPYTRDAIVLGVALRPVEDFRIYVEADYAFYVFGNADPWQFQFGVDWSTLRPTGIRGAPFFAINGMIREDVKFGGNLTVQSGWQWRGQSGQLLRAGVHYFNGKSNQGQFFNDFEHQIGLGVWYDF